MKFIDFIETNILNRKVIVCSFLLTFYLSFIDKINDKIHNLLIKDYINFEKGNTLAIIIFFILFGIILFDFFRKLIRGFQYSGYNLILPSIFLSIYFLYRFQISIFTYWDFKPFYGVIYYIDITTIYFISSIIIFIIGKCYSPNEKSSVLLLDNAITSQGKDLLNNNKLAENLLKTITNANTIERAVTIGVESKWGNGKTSFLNLLKEKIFLDKNLITIEYKPWISSDMKALQSSFFIQIQNELKKYTNNFTDQFSKYAELLFEVDFTNKNIIKKLTNNLLKKSNTIESQFEELNSLISSLNKSIIIFIDDLDRIEEEEVRSVLKLVRNTANFKNTIFLLTYDREIIENAYRDKDYIKKIIDLPYTLPAPKAKFEMETLFEKILNENASNALLNSMNFKEVLVGELYIGKLNKPFNLINSGFDNIRDIKLFINSILISFKEINTHIETEDYVLIKYIKFKYPKIYNILENNPEELLTLDKSSGIYKLDNYKGHEEKEFTNLLTKLEEVLKDSADDNYWQNKQIEDLVYCLIQLFKSDGNNMTKADSIRKYINFKKYFCSQIDVKMVSVKGLKTLLELDNEMTIKNEISKWFDDSVKITDNIIDGYNQLYDKIIYLLYSEKLENKKRYINLLNLIINSDEIDNLNIKNLLIDSDILALLFSNNLIEKCFNGNTHDLDRSIMSIIRISDINISYDDITQKIEIISFILQNQSINGLYSFSSTIINELEKYYFKIIKTLISNLDDNIDSAELYCSIIKKHWKLLSIRNDAENALTNILKNKTNLLEGIIINNVLEVNKAEFSGTMKYPYFIKLNYSVNNKIFINLKTLLSTINDKFRL